MRILVNSRYAPCRFFIPAPCHRLRKNGRTSNEKSMESFAKFEHEGWQRVAGKYDSVWARSTRQFIPSLLDAAEVNLNMSVLDVGSGPGYVAGAAAERGAIC